MSAVGQPLVLVSGFGPFEACEFNPSGELARALAAAPPSAVRVRAGVLPVSFARAPLAFDALLAEGDAPDLYLGLGVAKKAGFRLEQWGGPGLKCVPRPDVDGRTAEEYSRPGARLETRVDLTRVLAGLRGRGVAEVRVSRTAGGYVCEHLYHHLLARAAEHGRRGLFVHVPPLRFTPFERQVQVIAWVLEELAAEFTRSSQSSSTRRG